MQSPIKKSPLVCDYVSVNRHPFFFKLYLIVTILQEPMFKIVLNKSTQMYWFSFNSIVFEMNAFSNFIFLITTVTCLFILRYL